MPEGGGVTECAFELVTKNGRAVEGGSEVKRGLSEVTIPQKPFAEDRGDSGDGAVRIGGKRFPGRKNSCS